MRLVVSAKHFTARETVKKKNQERKKAAWSNFRRWWQAMFENCALENQLRKRKNISVYSRNEKLSLYKKVLRANWFFPLQPPNQARSQRHLFFWLAPRTQFYQTCVNRSRVADFKTSFCWPKEQRALWTRLHANYNKPTNQMKHNIIEFYNA